MNPDMQRCFVICLFHPYNIYTQGTSALGVDMQCLIDLLYTPVCLLNTSKREHRYVKVFCCLSAPSAQNTQRTRSVRVNMQCPIDLLYTAVCPSVKYI